jgi:hypothetical protein
VSDLGDLDFRSVSWAGSFLSVLTPCDIDVPLVGWLVGSFVVEEISNLGSLGSEVDTDNSLLISLCSQTGLNFDLLESSLGEDNSGIQSLGLGGGTSELEVKGGLNLSLGSELLLGVGFVLNLSLSFNLLEDGLGGWVLRVVSLKSTSLSGRRQEDRLEHVSGSQSEESQRTSETATEVLVLRSEVLSQGSEDVDSGVDLLTVVVFGSSADTFHEFVLVSRSQFSFFSELLSLRNDCDSLAFWASFVEEVHNFLVLEGSGGIGLDGGESSRVNLSQHGVLLGWGGENEVDGLLLHIQTNADLSWNSDSEGSDGLNGVSSSEWRQMVVDGRDSVEVESAK